MWKGDSQQVWWGRFFLEDLTAKEKSSNNFRIGRNGGTGGSTKKEDIEHVLPHLSTQRLCSKLKQGMSFGLDWTTINDRWKWFHLACRSQVKVIMIQPTVVDDYLATPGKAERRVNCLRWFPTWHRDKSHTNSQTIVVGTIDLRPLYKVNRGRCMQGWAEKPRGQVGFPRSLQRVLYTIRHESLTNYWVSVNEYKLTHHVSINSTLIVLTSFSLCLQHGLQTLFANLPSALDFSLLGAAPPDPHFST